MKNEKRAAAAVGESPGEDHKQAARQFLQLVGAGRIEEAYRLYTAAEGRHHNPFFAAGFPALREGMKQNHLQNPNLSITVQHVIGEGDLVAVHSHIVPSPGEAGIAAVHLFRFEGPRIVELWDGGQPVPAEALNPEGMF